jgi:cystathionine beta-lyase/cystathionine gamma-synthase
MSAGMIRVAVGLEHPADIEEDFAGALSAAQEVVA